jgi:hypothetical protein
VLVPTGYSDIVQVLFGRSLAISPDGNYLVVGTTSGYTTTNNWGSAWIFTRSGSTWTQTVSALRNTISPISSAQQAGNVALSPRTNPTKLWLSLSNQISGVGVMTGSGSTWTSNSNYTRNVTTSNVGYIYPTLATTSDGSSLIMGAPIDDSNVGVTRVYTINATTSALTLKQTLIGTGNIGDSSQGAFIALSSNNRVLVVCGPTDNSDAGAVWIFAK